MLTRYRISNFKAFKEISAIPLKPITLIYGQNSAGKSSIIQSLLMLKQSLGYQNSHMSLVSQGDLVDLGDYKNFINSHQSQKNITVELSFSIQEVFDYLEPYIQTFNLTAIQNIRCQMLLKNLDGYPSLDKMKIYLENDCYPVLSYCVDQEGDFILEKPEKRSKFWKSFLDNNSKNIQNFYFDRARKKISELFKISSQKLRDKLSSKQELSDHKKALENDIQKLNMEFKSLSDDDVQKQNIRNEVDSLEQELDEINYIFPLLSIHKDKILGELTECIYYFYSITPYSFLPNDLLERAATTFNSNPALDISYEVYTRDLTILKFISDFTSSITNKLSNILENLVYIAPLRAYPKRFHILGENTLSSEEMIYNNSHILEKINKIFTQFQLNYEVKVSSPNVISNPEFERIFSVRLVDTSFGTQSKHSISVKDVGFGVSQILPVLTQSLLHTNSTLLIEQPEIHIHPRLQAELAEVFADSYISNGNHFLIETHSENLILRFQKMIRGKRKIGNSQHVFTNQDISVIYVDRAEDCSYCVELRLDEDGGFIDNWPNGFFEESFNELFDF
jgi:predicted ATPase